ncbi:hypothetical protein D3C73_1500150 [compost metagenome]
MKRAQHQLFVTIDVESGPVQALELIEQERRELRGVGNEVALVRQQGFQLRVQHAVALEPLAAVL